MFLLSACVSFPQSHSVPVCKDRRLYDEFHVPLDRRLRPEILSPPPIRLEGENFG